MDYILKAENIKYKKILTDISFALKEDSFNILMGPNGSGKTTLVKCIAGLLEYDGKIVFKGKNINEIELRQIGIVSDFSSLLKGTAIYNIMFPLINLNESTRQAKDLSYKVAKKLGIEHLLLKNINELSIMEKKLLLLACATVYNPKLIIIDDSLDELDNFYRKKAVKYLKSMKQSTILFVTNNSEDIMLGDIVIVLKKGALVFNGSKNELFDNEKVILKANAKFPFLIDLSLKLKAYDLINDVIKDKREMIGTLWK